MNKENIIDYVAQTPYNSNKKVLEDMLDTLMDDNILQSDWSQNDETAKDYIKNRPFYEESEYITRIEELTAEFNGSDTFVSIHINNLQIPISKNEYIVTFDGIEYIGRMILDDDPYIVVSLSDGVNMEIFTFGSINIRSGDYAGVHTIKVEEKKAVVHTIENKYLGFPVYSGEGEKAICLNLDNNVASGIYSYAEGYITTASGRYSHAEGRNTTASGEYSHAEGRETKASGENSHAEGFYTIASGKNSHAEGRSTTASSEYQHVQGKYNIEDTTNTYSHIVGNGYFDTKTFENVYSNSHTLDWQGNAWYQGDVYVGSTSGTNKDAGSKKLATEEYVDTKIINGLSLGVHTDGKVYIFMNGSPIGNGIEINSVAGQ